MAQPRLRVIDGRSSDYVTLPAYVVDETRMEAAVARDERLAHTADVRHHLRVAMRALADGRFGLAGTWLVELDRLNERQAARARAIQSGRLVCSDCGKPYVVEQPSCPDGVEEVGHGRAA